MRGRAGSWYFGVCQGRGLRNTFVGGLVTSPTQANPLLAAFRGAGVDVLLDDKRPNGLWLSEVAYCAGLAQRPDVAGGLAVRYTLQRGLINGWPTPQTSPSPWQVTQVWRAAADGLLGMVAVEATADVPAVAVLGRIALGPGAVEAPTDGHAAWQCGPLQVRFFDTFGTASVAGYPNTPERRKPGGPASSGGRIWTTAPNPGRGSSIPPGSARKGPSLRPQCIFSPRIADGSPHGPTDAKWRPFSTPPRRR